MAETENETDGADLATVAASSYRKAVVGALLDGPATPSQITAQVDPEIAHVSRSLTELREVDVVRLLVPEETRKGRLYELTERGEAVAERLGVDGG